MEKVKQKSAGERVSEKVRGIAKKRKEKGEEKEKEEKSMGRESKINSQGNSISSEFRNFEEIKREVENIIKAHPSKDKDIRPWGGFISLWDDKTFKVKILFVLPGKRLSLQRHRWRKEKWIIAEGEAFITKGNQSFFMREGNTVMIEQGELHRIENKSDKILKIVEVWLGEKLLEDDIERIEDDFGRK